MYLDYFPYFSTWYLFHLGSRFVIGIVFVILATIAMIKISCGSKDKFALSIMSSTFLYGVTFIGRSYTTMLMINYGISYEVTYYIFVPLDYLRHIAALQVWIIGVCYWRSAAACSFEVSWANEKIIFWIGVAVAALYYLG